LRSPVLIYELRLRGAAKSCTNKARRSAQVDPQVRQLLRIFAPLLPAVANDDEAAASTTITAATAAATRLGPGGHDKRQVVVRPKIRCILYARHRSQARAIAYTAKNKQSFQ